MAQQGAQEKIGKGDEEFNRFEEELVGQYRAEMKIKMAEKLREMDQKASIDLLKTGDM